jgi:long-chain acyl-CoA synthetase
MRLTQGLQRAAWLSPSVTATIFGERRRTWSEIFARVQRLAGALVALGLKPGDRVYALAANSDYYVEYYYAVIWAGGVVVPGNTRWAGPEHDFAIADSGSTILFVDGHHHAVLSTLQTAAGLPTICMDVPDVPHHHLDIEALIEQYEPVAELSGAGDDLMSIFYTGGTTGRSKGVMLSHNSLAINYMCSTLVRPIRHDAIFLHSAPMFHLADAAMLFGITNTAGTHAIIPQFSAAAMVDIIERERVNIIVVVPTMFSMLGEYLANSPADLTSVTRVSYGAAPISEDLLHKGMRFFPNAEFAQAYGQTELSPAATVLESQFHDAGGSFGHSKLRSAGRALPFVDIQIWSENGEPLAVGEVGEIVVDSPGRMLGYWNQPELTELAIVNGWLKTGDAGYFDADGFLYVVDRVKDMIISGGENIYCAEVENALASHSSVQECAVIGVPDDHWGERVHAVIRLKPGTEADEGQIIAHCRKLIATYKCPRSIAFFEQPLPLSAAGKILKTELRKPYWNDAAKRVS